MKKLMELLVCSSVLLFLTGCISDLDSLEDGHHRVKQEKKGPVLKTVRMSFGGDFISESDEPLQRAGDGDTYVGINVFRTEKNKEDATEEKYAYGLFKKKEGISVDLLTGYNYRFEATVLVEREHKIFVSGTRIMQPFRIKDTDSFDNSAFEKSDIGSFHYTDNITLNSKRNSFIELASGVANVDAGDDFGPQYGDLWYPRVKRFYGILSSFDPEVADSVDIRMGYKSFGLKVIVNNLPSGTLTVADVTKLNSNIDKEEKQKLLFPNGLRLSSDGTAEWEGLYSLNNLKSESETFNLRFTWHKGGSERETFDTEVTVKPKFKKVLKLNISGTPNYTTKGNINLVMDNEDLSDEEQEVNGEFD